MRLLRQFNYLFFYKDILHRKKPAKHPSNVYSDIFMCLKKMHKNSGL